ncbi:MAG TPA: FAD-binding oxidoreductase [Blastocatellia bacterium]|nr:FAD-binding oxidoreductase [Blastocatellia bacterium]
MGESDRDVIGMLISVIGPEHTTAEPELSIDGLAPVVLAKPGSPAEVAECLRVCAEAGAAVVPAGLMTWLESGNPLRRAEVVLSLERMNRIVEYSPPDLTVTAEPGVAISALNEVVKGECQWLPLDPPGSDKASLGAIAACASSGPLRLGFGSPRDYVIGLRLAHADGSESKSGGKVAKNVAGYDMNKLYVGSYGTLAVLTELTFKLRPLPESFQTAVVLSDLNSLVHAAECILASEVIPASLFLTRGAFSDSATGSPDEWALRVRFADNAAAVKHQMSLMLKLTQGSEAAILSADGDSMWAAVADVDRLGRNALRLSVPISVTAAVVQEASTILPECAVSADLGTGVVRLAFDAEDVVAMDVIRQLRSRIADVGGSLVIERAGLALRRQIDAWGEIGATAELMRAVKERFDPRAILNPGRFVCGI